MSLVNLEFLNGVPEVASYGLGVFVRGELTDRKPKDLCKWCRFQRDCLERSRDRRFIRISQQLLFVVAPLDMW